MVNGQQFSMVLLKEKLGCRSYLLKVLSPSFNSLTILVKNCKQGEFELKQKKSYITFLKTFVFTLSVFGEQKVLIPLLPPL
jgi:hypothetical protein